MATANSNAAPQRPLFQAALTDEQVQKFEANHNETWGIKRRLMMMTMTCSSDEMIKRFGPLIVEDDGETFMELFEQIKCYRQHLEACTELAGSAMARLLLVGQFVADSEEAQKS